VGEPTEVTPPTGPLGLRPVAPAERVHALDVLRGLAILGILLVNIEYLRGTAMYRGMAGVSVDAPSGLDAAVSFAVGWLASGKFLSSLAILFGVGAGLLLARPGGSWPARQDLLRRRYRLLALLGVAHMLLLSPVDILFVYGIAGLLLVRFAHLHTRRLWTWCAVLLSSSAAASVALAWWMTPATTGGAEDPLDAAVRSFLLERADLAREAFRSGTYLDVLVANAWQAAIVQTGQLLMVPWILGLFLLGFAVARTLRIDQLRSHRRELRLAAIVGLGVGLPANLAVAPLGPMAMSSVLSPSGGSRTSAALAAAAMTLGAPLLAVGYLAVLTLLVERGRSVAPLGQVGRVALSAYLLQSALSLLLFAGFDRYDRSTTVEVLAIIVSVWAIVATCAVAWLRHVRAGPVEWLWRTATYGQRQPLGSDEPSGATSPTPSDGRR
jgi:uncharacterized protein